MKKKFIKRTLLSIFLALFVVIGIGCSSETTEKNESSNETTNEEVKDLYNVGEQVKLNDTILIVNSVKKSNGDEFEKPKKGNEFVIVDVTITNNGDSNISYNPFDFKIQNSKGQITDKGLITIDTDTSLNSGELAPKGSVSGTISFEEPKDDKELILQFNNSFFGKNDVKIKLN